MATSEPGVDDYEPTGDPEHVAYGKDFWWSCTCGAAAGHLTRRETAEAAAEEHETYCFTGGETTVRVNA